MPGDKSSFFKDKLIDFVLLNHTPSNPAAAEVYVALYNGDPFGAGTEVSTSGTGYARQRVYFTSSSAGSTSNSNTISFGTATGAGYGSVDYFALYNASTGGNILYADQLASAQTVSAGNEAKFNPSSISVTEE